MSDVIALSPDKGVQRLDVFRETGHALDMFIDELFPDLGSTGSFGRISRDWKGWNDQSLDR